MALVPVRQGSRSTAIAVPDLQRLVIADDVRQLLAEASAPVEERRRTFSEWWRKADIRKQQLDKKVEAGQTARTLVTQRSEIMKAANEMVQLAVNLRRQKLEAELAELELEDRIAERIALRDVRLETLRMHEKLKHRKLLGSDNSAAAKRERVLAEHRQNRLAQVRAGHQMLQDFLNEVHLVCESRSSIHERALRIRNLLDVFELDEESLPADARWILKTSEKINDAS